MKFRSICTIAAIFALLIQCAYSFGATQVIKGTVVASPGGASSVDVRVGGDVVTVTRTQKTVITRGENGKPSRAVPLREFARGDQFVAIIENGTTVSMRASYDVFKINSITFSAPVPLKPGDIITVDLTGTPKAKAAFSVKDLIATVKMTEMSVGSYHGTVKVPKGKTVRNAPLVGYLGVGDVHAAPVQASRLVTVQPDSEESRLTLPPLGFVKAGPVAEPAKLPVVKPLVAPTEPAKSSPAPVAVEPAKQIEKPTPTQVAKISLSSPVDGTVIRHVIAVKGTAEPGSTVRVAVTYSNNLSGLLKLAGEVASENVSVGKDGEFRVGPIALDGPLATDGLRFTVKAYYPDRADHASVEVSVTGHRE